MLLGFASGAIRITRYVILMFLERILGQQGINHFDFVVLIPTTNVIFKDIFFQFLTNVGLQNY